MKSETQCSVRNCTTQVEGGRNLCSRHRGQLNQKGEILKKSSFDVNPMWVENGLGYMEVYSYGKGLPVLVGTVCFDKADFDKIKGNHWIYSKRWKAVYRKRHEISQLMKLIAGGGKDKTAIPINNDPFDCRQDNIDLVSISERLHMTGVSKLNTSGYRGISQRRGGWRVQLWVNKKLFSASTETLEEAVSKRIELEILHLGKQYTFHK